MFGFLKKKLNEGVKKLSRAVAEKEPEPTFEQEEEFAHEKAPEPEQFLKEEPDRLEKEEEKEEHFEREGLPEPAPAQAEKRPHPPEEERTSEPPLPEEGKETLEEREPQQPQPTLEDKILEKEERLEKKGFLSKLKGVSKVAEKELSAQDIDAFFGELEADLLQANIALEVVDGFRARLKEELAEKRIRRGQTEEVIREAFTRALTEVLTVPRLDLEGMVRSCRAAGRPALFLVLGFNGSGKTTSIAKLAHRFQQEGFQVVLAAADTYRAASVEQLEVHGEKLGCKVVKHQYGADPAAVIFDAVKHAQACGAEVVLADTAGRTHVNQNLIDELKKIVRVNKPDLKILVLDSLTGNDIVPQAQKFDQAVGVDALILTKVEVNEKGGSILSAAAVTKKPVLFLGTGQGYGDLQPYDPEALAKELLE
ncbi:MAG: signal recognition particle-docking protein FtsY [Candidatus Aenigmarchaeota archaeon]|nr:signal recognition particle-docking protein FtsY [Candidatus Aenigmarchaeota archaeon]